MIDRAIPGLDTSSFYRSGQIQPKIGPRGMLTGGLSGTVNYRYVIYSMITAIICCFSHPLGAVLAAQENGYAFARLNNP